MEEKDIQLVQDLIVTATKESMAFSTRKLGDTPTDAQQLTPKGYVDSVFGALFSLIGNSSVSTGGVYGDGSDGAVSFDGAPVVGASIISASVYSLTRNVYYSSASVATGNTLKPSQYIVYNSGSFFNWGFITAEGNPGTVGGNGVAATSGSGGLGGAGGAGGSSLPTGYFPSVAAGGTGANGGDGRTPTVANLAGDNGRVSAVASPTTHSFFNGSGLSSGNGGNGGIGTTGAANNPGTGGTSGSVATSTLYLLPPRTVGRFDEMLDLDTSTLTEYFYSGWCSNPGGGGGGSGGADLDLTDHTNSGGGGGGGGAGGAGGFITLFSRSIINNGIITVVGGDGGNGGNGGNAFPAPTSPGLGAGGGGTGGGGSGGNGGVFFYVTGSYTNNSSVLVTGGSAGNSGQTVGTAGLNGTQGVKGIAGTTGRMGSVFGIII